MFNWLALVHWLPLAALIVLFVLIMLSFELGQMIGERWRAKHHDTEIKGVGALEAAVFGLLSLLIAFTFSGAVTRFEQRRDLTRQEAIAVSAAKSQIALLPAQSQSEMRTLLKNYVNVRLKLYNGLSDVGLAKTTLDQSHQIQRALRYAAIEAVRQSDEVELAMPILVKLDEIDAIQMTQDMARTLHPPYVIYAMLALLAIVCSLMSGFSIEQIKSRGLLHVLAFAFSTTLTFAVTVDLEAPRFGLIRIDSTDAPLAIVGRSLD